MFTVILDYFEPLNDMIDHCNGFECRVFIISFPSYDEGEYSV